MKIETKYNVGDTVYYVNYDKIVSDKIWKIQIVAMKNAGIGGKDLSVMYSVFNNSFNDLPESAFFRSKEELLAELAK